MSDRLKAALLRFAKVIGAAAAAAVIAGVAAAITNGQVIDPKALGIAAVTAALLAAEKFFNWTP